MDQTITTEWKRYTLIQLPIMLLLLAQSMSGTILQDLIVYRTCTITLNINETECLIMHNNSNSAEAFRINSYVQPHASLILISKTFIESIFPSLLCLFLGPWSDKYGRKPVILSGYIGICLSYLMFSIMANWEIAPWYLLIAYLPMAFLGGLSVLTLGSLCYITDITDDNERAWHLAWFEASISLGLLIGLFSGPVIFQAFGYTVIFSVATIACIAATLYILFCVPETVHNRNFRGCWKIFDFVLLKDLVRACVKKRNEFNRSLVWTCIICLTLFLIIIQGELTIGYLFASARLGWTVEEYSTYVGVSVVLSIFGTIFGIKLMQTYAGLPEAIVAIISVISAIGGALIHALVWQSWHMYLLSGIGMFSDVSRAMIRSILTKSVPEQDRGKVFSLTTSLETMLPFAAATLYTFIYSHYMPPVYPVPVWFLSIAFYIVIIILLINIHRQIVNRNDTAYRSLISSDSDH